MACATLKRTIDWESINQRPTKRRRFNAIDKLGNASPSSSSAGASTSRSALPTNKSAFGPYVAEPPSSVFGAAASGSKVSATEIAQCIRDAIGQHSSKRRRDSDSSGSEMATDSPNRVESPPPSNVVRSPEKALFTFKQVQMICERMMKERENELREEYQAILTAKLADQYDVFVKFTYDQIQQRYGATPSYLS